MNSTYTALRPFVQATALTGALLLSATALSSCGLTEAEQDTSTSQSQQATHSQDTTTAQDAAGAQSTDNDSATVDDTGNGFDSEGRMIVTYNSIGPYKLGKDTTALSAAGAPSAPLTQFGGTDDKCLVWTAPLEHDGDINVFSRDGKILTGLSWSVDWEENRGHPVDWVTDRGIARGDTAAELRAAYPNLQGTDKSDEGTFTVWTTNDKGHSIFFIVTNDDTSPGPLQDDAEIVNMFVTMQPDPSWIVVDISERACGR